MYKRSIISVGISVIIGEVSPTYFSLELRPPLEFSLGFVAIEVSLWRCSELLPEVSPEFDRTEAILGEISPTYASLPEVSLEMRPPHEFSLGFVAIKVSLWHCGELLPEVSPVFDRTEAILGEISPTYASLPEISLQMPPPREFSLGFVAIEVSLWHCSELLPEVSPVFDRTEAILGEISPTYANLPEVSLGMLPSRESLSGSLPSRFFFGAEASPVFDRAEVILEEISPTYYRNYRVSSASQNLNVRKHVRTYFLRNCVLVVLSEVPADPNIW